MKIEEFEKLIKWDTIYQPRKQEIEKYIALAKTAKAFVEAESMNKDCLEQALYFAVKELEE